MEEVHPPPDGLPQADGGVDIIDLAKPERRDAGVGDVVANRGLGARRIGLPLL